MNLLYWCLEQVCEGFVDSVSLHSGSIPKGMEGCKELAGIIPNGIEVARSLQVPSQTG
jgi:hypothetical protein